MADEFDVRKYIPEGVLPSRETLERLAKLSIPPQPIGLGTDENRRPYDSANFYREAMRIHEAMVPDSEGV